MMCNLATEIPSLSLPFTNCQYRIEDSVGFIVSFSARILCIVIILFCSSVKVVQNTLLAWNNMLPVEKHRVLESSNETALSALQKVYDFSLLD